MPDASSLLPLGIGNPNIPTRYLIFRRLRGIREAFSPGGPKRGLISALMSLPSSSLTPDRGVVEFPMPRSDGVYQTRTLLERLVLWREAFGSSRGIT